MILKRILIILGIMIVTSLICSGLLLLGNKENENEIKIYEESNIEDEESIKLSNDVDEKIINNDVISTNEKENKEDKEKKVNSVDKIVEKSNTSVNNSNKTVSVSKVNNSENTKQNNKTEDNSQQVNEQAKKEDIYTFKRNDTEIQKIINMAKTIIRENKDNRCSELIDKLDSINFIVAKSGNLFYPLIKYRIENIVFDNYYPEFYVYAEDIFKNGEYVRTEYYFN